MAIKPPCQAAVDKLNKAGENKVVAQSKKKTILIVEDEQLLSEMYREVFEKEDLSVISTANAQEALRLAETKRPDFILLDILLPGDNGLYFLEQRKAHAALSSIPVVAFSNFDDPHMRKNALSLGAKDYLIKTDYTPQEVVRKVRSYIL